MLALHRYLGLSDAMMVAPAPGERHSLLYNVAMVFTFLTCACLYLMHTVWLAPQNWSVAAIKVIVLAIAWTRVVQVAP